MDDEKNKQFELYLEALTGSHTDAEIAEFSNELLCSIPKGEWHNAVRTVVIMAFGKGVNAVISRHPELQLIIPAKPIETQRTDEETFEPSDADNGL